MARLTHQVIRRTKSDVALLKKLFGELEVSVPASLHDDLDDFVAAIQDLPAGLHAMVATYQLDVSMALEDLGWHFANWHAKFYAGRAAALSSAHAKPRAGFRPQCACR